MPSLLFVMPAHGRVNLARICMRKLRITCEGLIDNGVDASAVVVADDENLDVAREMGFAWVERDNTYTSLKFNDGIFLACKKMGADYVVPIGSDDWVDHRLFLDLPDTRTMVGFQRMAFVREDGLELTVRHVDTEGGCGIRIWPRHLMAATGYWPADPDRVRGCDTSILHNTRAAFPNMRVEHRAIDPLHIVDWKSPGENLNPYRSLQRHRCEYLGDPFSVLAGRYPADLVEEMQAHYGLVPV